MPSCPTFTGADLCTAPTRRAARAANPLALIDIERPYAHRQRRRRRPSEKSKTPTHARAWLALLAGALLLLLLSLTCGSFSSADILPPQYGIEAWRAAFSSHRSSQHPKRVSSFAPVVLLARAAESSVVVDDDDVDDDDSDDSNVDVATQNRYPASAALAYARGSRLATVNSKKHSNQQRDVSRSTPRNSGGCLRSSTATMGLSRRTRDKKAPRSSPIFRPAATSVPDSSGIRLETITRLPSDPCLAITRRDRCAGDCEWWVPPSAWEVADGVDDDDDGVPDATSRPPEWGPHCRTNCSRFSGLGGFASCYARSAFCVPNATTMAAPLPYSPTTGVVVPDALALPFGFGNSTNGSNISAYMPLSFMAFSPRLASSLQASPSFQCFNPSRCAMARHGGGRRRCVALPECRWTYNFTWDNGGSGGGARIGGGALFGGSCIAKCEVFAKADIEIAGVNGRTGGGSNSLFTCASLDREASGCGIIPPAQPTGSSFPPSCGYRHPLPHLFLAPYGSTHNTTIEAITGPPLPQHVPCLSRLTMGECAERSLIHAVSPRSDNGGWGVGGVVGAAELRPHLYDPSLTIARFGHFCQWHPLSEEALRAGGGGGGIDSDSSSAGGGFCSVNCSQFTPEECDLYAPRHCVVALASELGAKQFYVCVARDHRTNNTTNGGSNGTMSNSDAGASGNKGGGSKGASNETAVAAAKGICRIVGASFAACEAMRQAADGHTSNANTFCPSTLLCSGWGGGSPATATTAGAASQATDSRPPTDAGSDAGVAATTSAPTGGANQSNTTSFNISRAYPCGAIVCRNFDAARCPAPTYCVLFTFPTNGSFVCRNADDVDDDAAAGVSSSATNTNPTTTKMINTTTFASTTNAASTFASTTTAAPGTSLEPKPSVVPSSTAAPFTTSYFTTATSNLPNASNTTNAPATSPPTKPTTDAPVTSKPTNVSNGTTVAPSTTTTTSTPATNSSTATTAACTTAATTTAVAPSTLAPTQQSVTTPATNASATPTATETTETAPTTANTTASTSTHVPTTTAVPTNATSTVPPPSTATTVPTTTDAPKPTTAPTPSPTKQPDPNIDSCAAFSSPEFEWLCPSGRCYAPLPGAGVCLDACPLPYNFLCPQTTFCAASPAACEEAAAQCGGGGGAGGGGVRCWNSQCAPSLAQCPCRDPSLVRCPNAAGTALEGDGGCVPAESKGEERGLIDEGGDGEKKTEEEGCGGDNHNTQYSVASACAALLDVYLRDGPGRDGYCEGLGLVRCAESGVCRPTYDDCPCPAAAPIRCYGLTERRCAASVAHCNMNCPSPLPSSDFDTPSSSTAAAVFTPSVRCWDGSCALSVADCSCPPRLPIRCPMTAAITKGGGSQQSGEEKAGADAPPLISPLCVASLVACPCPDGTQRCPEDGDAEEGGAYDGADVPVSGCRRRCSEPQCFAPSGYGPSTSSSYSSGSDDAAPLFAEACPDLSCPTAPDDTNQYGALDLDGGLAEESTAEVDVNESFSEGEEEGTTVPTKDGDNGSRPQPYPKLACRCTDAAAAASSITVAINGSSHLEGIAANAPFRVLGAASYTLCGTDLSRKLRFSWSIFDGKGRTVPLSGSNGGGGTTTAAKADARSLYVPPNTLYGDYSTVYRLVLTVTYAYNYTAPPSPTTNSGGEKTTEEPSKGGDGGLGVYGLAPFTKAASTSIYLSTARTLPTAQWVGGTRRRVAAGQPFTASVAVMVPCQLSAMGCDATAQGSSNDVVSKGDDAGSDSSLFGGSSDSPVTSVLSPMDSAAFGGGGGTSGGGSAFAAGGLRPFSCEGSGYTCSESFWTECSAVDWAGVAMRCPKGSFVPSATTMRALVFYAPGLYTLRARIDVGEGWGAKAEQLIEVVDPYMAALEFQKEERWGGAAAAPQNGVDLAYETVDEGELDEPIGTVRRAASALRPFAAAASDLITDDDQQSSPRLPLVSLRCVGVYTTENITCIAIADGPPQQATSSSSYGYDIQWLLDGVPQQRFHNALQLSVPIVSGLEEVTVRVTNVSSRAANSASYGVGAINAYFECSYTLLDAAVNSGDTGGPNMGIGGGIFIGKNPITPTVEGLRTRLRLTCDVTDVGQPAAGALLIAFGFRLVSNRADETLLTPFPIMGTTFECVAPPVANAAIELTARAFKNGRAVASTLVRSAPADRNYAPQLFVTYSSEQFLDSAAADSSFYSGGGDAATLSQRLADAEAEGDVTAAVSALTDMSVAMRTLAAAEGGGGVVGSSPSLSAEPTTNSLANGTEPTAITKLLPQQSSTVAPASSEAPTREGNGKGPSTSSSQQLRQSDALKAMLGALQSLLPQPASATTAPSPTSGGGGGGGGNGGMGRPTTIPPAGLIPPNHLTPAPQKKTAPTPMSVTEVILAARAVAHLVASPDTDLLDNGDEGGEDDGGSGGGEKSKSSESPTSATGEPPASSSTTTDDSAAVLGSLSAAASASGGAALQSLLLSAVKRLPPCGGTEKIVRGVVAAAVLSATLSSGGGSAEWRVQSRSIDDGTVNAVVKTATGAPTPFGQQRGFGIMDYTTAPAETSSAASSPFEVANFTGPVVVAASKFLADRAGGVAVRLGGSSATLPRGFSFAPAAIVAPTTASPNSDDTTSSSSLYDSWSSTMAFGGLAAVRAPSAFAGSFEGIDLGSGATPAAARGMKSMDKKKSKEEEEEEEEDDKKHRNASKPVLITPNTTVTFAARVSDIIRFSAYLEGSPFTVADQPRPIALRIAIGNISAAANRSAAADSAAGGAAFLPYSQYTAAAAIPLTPAINSSINSTTNNGTSSTSTSSLFGLGYNASRIGTVPTTFSQHALYFWDEVAGRWSREGIATTGLCGAEGAASTATASQQTHLCGTTRHFTAFAVFAVAELNYGGGRWEVFDPPVGPTDPNDDDKDGRTSKLAYILGGIVAGVFVVAIVVVLALKVNNLRRDSARRRRGGSDGEGYGDFNVSHFDMADGAGGGGSLFAPGAASPASSPLHPPSASGGISSVEMRLIGARASAASPASASSVAVLPPVPGRDSDADSVDGAASSSEGSGSGGAEGNSNAADENRGDGAGSGGVAYSDAEGGGEASGSTAAGESSVAIPITERPLHQLPSPTLHRGFGFGGASISSADSTPDRWGPPTRPAAVGGRAAVPFPRSALQQQQEGGGQRVLPKSLSVSTTSLSSRESGTGGA